MAGALARGVVAGAAAWVAVSAGACGGDDGGAVGEPEALACPARIEAPSPVPGVAPEHLELDYWLARLGEDHDLDAPLLSSTEIDNHNAAMRAEREGYFPQRDLLEPFASAEWAEKVASRRTWSRDKLAAGEYVTITGDRVEVGELAPLEAEVSLAGATPALRVSLDDIQIRCAPFPAPFYSANSDKSTDGADGADGADGESSTLAPAIPDVRFDRNACSMIRPQEVVQVIAAWPNGMQLARTRYAFGWIPADAPLSPPIPADLRERFVRGPRVQLLADADAAAGVGSVSAPAGTVLPAAGKDGSEARAVYIAGPDGFHTSESLAAEAVRPTRRALTRRALLEELWRYLGSPFGLGGVGGGRDCSRMLLDVFETFDLRLPRHSKWQSAAGTFWIDIAEDLPASERLLLLDAASRAGVVLLHLPGHIAFYLGRDRDGEPMILHAIASYQQTCGAADGAASVRDSDTEPAAGERGAESEADVGEVTVTRLALGRGTSKRSFLARMSRITVIGKPPGAALAGVATTRPSAPAAAPKKCRDSQRAAIFFSPELPNANEPMRVIAALDADPGTARLQLIAPDGTRHTPESVVLGGPPHGFVATVEEPASGRWTAIVGDGADVVACARVRVSGRTPRPIADDPSGPIWRPRRAWGVATENLFALFVERLLDYSIEDDRVWPNLDSLTRDRERNILYNHRGYGEDERLSLRPDCADLPYTFRAYFAWKLRLPFGYRRCTRAKNGRPPDCSKGRGDNLISRLELADRGKIPDFQPRSDVTAFERFLDRKLRNSVHSSSGRTRPGDETSDLYPVALTREALKPGTVFIDPYGHVLTIADWIPQGAGDDYGILVGVDAQPDGTVGRRRFWRGSFLFKPETSAGAAGFKAFRPHVLKEGTFAIEVSGPDGDGADEDEDGAGNDSGDASGASAGGDAGEGATGEGATPRTITRIGIAEPLDNVALERTRVFPRLSTQQYDGTRDGFYDAMEALINPRPLDPVSMQVALIDALYESVKRRVTSVDNGEAYMAEVGFRPMSLPEGASIFLASEPWESYSTPSRDLRLLISIDSVVRFPDMVARAPARFGVEPGPKADALVARVRQALEQGLAARSFEYTRSDGGKHTLTLADVAARAEGFEMAYNPNDCPEIRWAAPAGSDELTTCKRRASDDQRARMEGYRDWFRTRERPPN